MIGIKFDSFALSLGEKRRPETDFFFKKKNTRSLDGMSMGMGNGVVFKCG